MGNPRIVYAPWLEASRFPDSVLYHALARSYEGGTEDQFFDEYVYDVRPVPDDRPFFFYSIGGYLVIQGQLTLGALVAALSAYKDLVSPWKELLNFYNQFMDSSIRYDAIIEKFDPEGLLDEDRQTLIREPVPRLDGPIRIRNVSWQDNGTRVLRNVSATIDGGSLAWRGTLDILGMEAEA